MEATVFEATLTGGRALHITAWYADNPAPSDLGDAAIGYRMNDPATGAQEGFGEMVYHSDQTVYQDLLEARADLAVWLRDHGVPVILLDPTDIDPATYEE